MDTATLIVLCAAWLLIAGTLVFRLIRPRPASRGSRWMGSGLLIIMTVAVISTFAHHRNWPIPRLLVIDWLTMAVGLIGVGCVATSLVIQARNGRT